MKTLSDISETTTTKKLIWDRKICPQKLKFPSQIVGVRALAISPYYNSQLKRAIVGCFLALQDRRLSPKKGENP